MLFIDECNLAEWEPLLPRAEVSAMVLPGREYTLNDIARGNGLDPDRCFKLAIQYSEQFDYIIGECSGAFLWHAVFRLTGDRTPFVIIPRYNHFYPPHAYAMLLSSQLRQHRDRVYTGCSAAGRAFSLFGFQCEPSYLPGLDLGSFRVLASSKKSLCPLLGLPVDRDILLYTGRVADDKNILGLLNAFGKVKLCRRAELVICYHFFRQAYLDQCTERARSIGNVRLIYRPGLEALVGYYNAADIFVSAAVSTFETFGRSPVESMACGTPPVVPCYNGFRETVPPGAGFLVPLASGGNRKRVDPDRFVETVVTSLGDRQGLMERREVGIQRAKNFARERILEALLTDLVSASSQEGGTLQVTQNLCLEGYPYEVCELWPSIEGRPLAELVCNFIRSGTLPAWPEKEAVDDFVTSWFAEF
ncbi:MAG TPA: glycosyltransferase family 4 protein [Thermoanaerobaculia bacterium]|nr:glycosyltransferase family 4 protein [Thermoanaerobaculia bacterium]